MLPFAEDTHLKNALLFARQYAIARPTYNTLKFIQIHGITTNATILGEISVSLKIPVEATNAWLRVIPHLERHNGNMETLLMECLCVV